MACAAVLVLIVGLAYAPVFSASYVYEDARWLGQEGATVDARGLSVLAWQVTPDALSGHVLSLGLHLLTGALLWVFLRRLALSALTAYLAVLVFLRHPLTVESVAYLAARTELITAIGVLGACILTAGPWRWWTAPAILGALLIGLGGKETAAIALLLIPLTLWVTRSTWWEPATWLGTLGLTIGVIVMGGPQRLANIGDEYGITATDWLLAQSAAAHRLLSLSLWPSGLTVDPDIDLITHGWRLAAVSLLAGLSVLAYRLRQTQPLITFGLTWTLLTILPRLIVQTPRGYLNDHQGYLALIGITIAAAAWSEEINWRLGEDPKRPA